MRKKLLSLSLALAMCLSLCAPALAAQFDDKTFYRDQLTGEALEMYDFMVENMDRLQKPNARISFSRRLPGNAAASRYLEEATLDAMANGFDWDHPEIFWYSNMWVEWSTPDRTTYTITIGPNTGMSWRGGGRSYERDAATVKAMVAELANGARAAGDSRYEQLLYVHDWLTTHNRYNAVAAPHSEHMTEYRDTTPWKPISALSEDLDPVCEGYARAFKLVCEALDVPCIIVQGDSDGVPHMWNYVQMENGLWYGVDVTYDDPIGEDQARQPLVSGMESQYFFLVGGEYKFSGRVLNKRWAYPALASSDYDPANVEKLAYSSAGVDPEDAGIAYPSATGTVTVDGTPVEFWMYALRDGNGGTTNYIKLRDLADILDGTPAQFNVGWDGSIALESHSPYTTRDGSEGQPVFQGDQSYMRCASDISVDGKPVALQAFTLTDWGGGGSNYFKLRDLGQALGFNVGWTAERGLFVETDKPYDAND